jgi:hypothetical protein
VKAPYLSMRGTIVMISKMFTHVCNASSRIPSSSQRDWPPGKKGDCRSPVRGRQHRFALLLIPCRGGADDSKPAYLSLIIHTSGGTFYPALNHFFFILHIFYKLFSSSTNIERVSNFFYFLFSIHLHSIFSNLSRLFRDCTATICN